MSKGRAMPDGWPYKSQTLACLPGVVAPASESPSRARFIVPVVCRWQSQDLAARLVRSSRLGSGILDGVLASRVCARLRCLFGSGGPTLSAMWRDKICSVRELYDGLLAQSCHKKKMYTQ
jgi:hypothetical protein